MPPKRSDRPARARWLRRILVAVLVLAVVLVPAGIWEMRTSTLQSRFFTRIAADATWQMATGPSDRIRFPDAGPFDQRMGYTHISGVTERLVERDFEVVGQARMSDGMLDLLDRGFFTIYQEKSQGGLIVRDRDGEPFHRTPSPARIYPAFDSIPEVLWRSLLYIENREFLDPDHPRRNPAVEWDRLARAVMEMGLRTLGSDRNVPGGSTLATQLEKFRHSPEGRTGSAGDKVRQMGSASLRAYRGGPETLDDQRRIVREYLNSVPLAAQRGHGEVVGTADGLWAWYGTPFDEANRLLRAAPGTEPDSARGRVYRQALSLIVAHRRPSYHLTQAEGRTDLADLVDRLLPLLEAEGIVDPALARAAAGADLRILDRAPPLPEISFVRRKAADQVRNHLLTLTGAANLYELDRWDLEVRSTLDMAWQTAAAAVLDSLESRDFVNRAGFGGDRLLGPGDPSRVLYSVTLLESTPQGNAVRIQTDNLDAPLSLSGAGRLELGSTAKLRTLVTYLEVVAELHGRLAALPGDSLAVVPVASQDRLTAWAVGFLRRHPSAGLRETLDSAMVRTYSANPAERFGTGGGVQTFANFDRTYDGRVMTLREAFRQSVNLPFVRVMRDLVHYYMFRAPGSTARILEDATDPARQEYLARFADREGREFLRQFLRKYEGLTGSAIMGRLVLDRDLGPRRTAWAFRAVAPEATLAVFETFLANHTPYSALSAEAMAALYEDTDPSAQTLNDLGFLARIHPLELWLVRYKLDHPGATPEEAVEASTEVRQEVYQWLFRTRRRNAQDQRIRTMLEIESFQEIHRSWQRLGYPFASIVPSYGTAIGSSGDRPLALAELVGIIRNGGIARPVVRVPELRFARATPFETRFARRPVEGERVMDAEVAAVVQDAMVDVVENGTARRVLGSMRDAEGEPLVMGGKTGTGDNRYRVFGANGALVESRTVNRTATLAFFAGDRWFGVVTAYVPGEEAAAYRFTSALPSEVLRYVAGVMGPVTAEDEE